jgi:hypothetical protein
MAHHGKRTMKAREGVDREKAYPLPEAVKMVKARAKAKFDETIEVAMNLGVDPRHADQMVRGVVNLPNGSGRTVRVAVFARGAKAEEATAAGADVVGAEDLVEKVQGGSIDFDRVIATPDMMPLLDREDEDQHVADHEHRQGKAHHGEHHHDAVDELVRLPGGEHAHRDGEADGDHEGRNRERERRLDALGDQTRDG